MSLEVALEKNTAALTALLAHIVGGGLVKEPSMKVPQTVIDAGKAIVAGTKPTPKADAKEAAQDVQPAGTTPVDMTTTPADPLDYERDIKPKALALAKAKGRDALFAVLGTFGAQKANDVKPEQFADLFAALDKAMA